MTIGVYKTNITYKLDLHLNNFQLIDRMTNIIFEFIGLIDMRQECGCVLKKNRLVFIVVDPHSYSNNFKVYIKYR